MASNLPNGQSNSKAQNLPDPRAPQQPGPAQLQVGPTKHAAPGPHPNQGLHVAGQQQPMASPVYNQGVPNPTANHGQPIAGQPQPILSPPYYQGPGPYPNQGAPGPYPNQGHPGPYPNQGGLPISGQPQPMQLPQGYNQGYPQVIQTQPPVLSPNDIQVYPQALTMQPGILGMLQQGKGGKQGARGRPPPESYDREGPSAGVKLKPGDDEACISASAEFGEVSKDFCGGCTTLICAGPEASCDMAFDCDPSGISVENGCTLSLCEGSCILGRCCLLSLGLELDTKVSYTNDEVEFELLGIGCETAEGCSLKLILSTIGFIDEEKKKKYEEKRQRRKERKREKREKQEEQRVGEVTGVTNNGATVEDAV